MQSVPRTKVSLHLGPQDQALLGVVKPGMFDERTSTAVHSPWG